jgi:hypothetical protein
MLAVQALAGAIRSAKLPRARRQGSRHPNGTSRHPNGTWSDGYRVHQLGDTPVVTWETGGLAFTRREVEERLERAAQACRDAGLRVRVEWHLNEGYGKGYVVPDEGACP